MNYENLSDLYSSSIDSTSKSIPPRNTPYYSQIPQVPQIPQIQQIHQIQHIPRIQQIQQIQQIPQILHINQVQQIEPKNDCSYACSISNFSKEQDPRLQPIVMNGTNPIRNGMYTAAHPTACSRYGSSNINLGPGEFYTGTPWCQVGIVMNESITHLNNVYVLEAQFIGNSWSFRVKDPITGIYIYISTIGNGPNGAYRTNDMLTVPGKEGLWKVQVQIQYQPYILYVP